MQDCTKFDRRQPDGVTSAGAKVTLQQLWQENQGRGVSSEAVFSTLRTAILQQVLVPSDRLSEESLAKTFGVSRTPVREALFCLEAKRLAVRIPRRGLVVAGVSPTETVDIYVVRQMVEGLAARLAAESISPAELFNLEQLTDQLAEATTQRNIQMMFDLSLSFHEGICRAGRNNYLLSIMEDIHNRIRRIQGSTLAQPGRGEEALAEHRELLAALRLRDPDAAESVARRHMGQSMAVRMQMNKLLMAR